MNAFPITKAKFFDNTFGFHIFVRFTEMLNKLFLHRKLFIIVFVIISFLLAQFIAVWAFVWSFPQVCDNTAIGLLVLLTLYFIFVVCRNFPTTVAQRPRFVLNLEKQIRNLFWTFLLFLFCKFFAHLSLLKKIRWTIDCAWLFNLKKYRWRLPFLFYFFLGVTVMHRSLKLFDNLFKG